MSGIDGILDAALEIAEQRKQVIFRLRDALKRGDDERALELAKELCGLHDETSDRIN